MLIRLLIIAFLCLVPALSGAEEAVPPPAKIISLAPNVTEILFSLGLSDNIAGVTTFCDYPPEAKKKPKIGGMSNPSLEAVVSSRPDIVIMTTDGNPREFEERLRALNIKTYVLRARRIHELPDEIRALGKALGVREKAGSLADEMKAAMERFGAKSKSDKKVLFIVWPEPLMVAGTGTAIDDAINLLGYKNPAGGSAPYPKYSIEEAIRQAPDIILIGGSMGQEDMEKLSKRLLKRLKSTPAVRNKKVFFVSDSLYRLGPRIPKGIEEMSGVIAPAGDLK